MFIRKLLKSTATGALVGGGSVGTGIASYLLLAEKDSYSKALKISLLFAGAGALLGGAYGLIRGIVELVNGIPSVPSLKEGAMVGTACATAIALPLAGSAFPIAIPGIAIAGVAGASISLGLQKTAFFQTAPPLEKWVDAAPEVDAAPLPLLNLVEPSAPELKM